MSSSDYREPTNDELWAQPPLTATGQPSSSSQGLAPRPQTPLPAPAPPHHPPTQQQRPDRTVFVLAVVSLALGIPLSAISTSSAGLLGLLVVWIGIVLVNAVYARSRRP